MNIAAPSIHVLGTILSLASAGVLAQGAPPVVISSVKLTADVDEGIKGNNFQGGVYRTSNAPLTVLLNTAYGVTANRIIGAPEWVAHDRWDVEAKVDGGAGGPTLRVNEVVQAVLRDRFKLNVAMEKRDRPIYALRLAREDGRLGPNLVRSAFACVQGDFAQQRKLVESGVSGSNGQRPCTTRSHRGIISFAGLPIANLVQFFFVDRVIQDQTGLTGAFDATVTWTDSGDQVADQAAMFSALREQLGLKLNRRPRRSTCW